MNDKKYMKIAIELAKKAFINGDIPVGAVLVNQELEIIGTGYNQKEITHNPTDVQLQNLLGIRDYHKSDEQLIFLSLAEVEQTRCVYPQNFQTNI